MDTEIIIAVSVLGGAWLVLLIVVIVLFAQLQSLKKQLAEIGNSSRLRVQKLKMNSDRNHAFHNPAISPDEELSRRGYSMYSGPDAQSDVESGRHQLERQPERQPERPQERQTGGQFVDELIHELDHRQQRQQQHSTNGPPPFLLQSIQDNKMKTRSTMNPIANGHHGRQSDTNPNFIY